MIELIQKKLTPGSEVGSKVNVFYISITKNLTNKLSIISFHWSMIKIVYQTKINTGKICPKTEYPYSR
jgi:hypothetical protein